MKFEKTISKYKYTNKFMVSYPKDMCEDARKWVVKKGISFQDLQRKAMEFYLNHLNHDQIVFNDKENGRQPNKNDGKRAYLNK